MTNGISDMSTEKSTSLDDAFKSIMRDSYILAQTLQPLFKEFEGKDEEYVRSCLPIREGNREIVGIGSEYDPGRKGPVIMDSVFELRIPGKAPRTVIVGLEGQGKRNPGYRLVDRAKYYTSCMIVDQKDRYFSHDNYSDICKVVSIWVVLNPRKDERNTIVRYYTAEDYVRDFDGKGPIERCDLEEIFLINIGNADDLPRTMMGLMNTLFSKGLTYGERVQRLDDIYNIKDADSLIDKLRVFSMSLQEEIIETYREEGIEDAISSGAVVTREEYDRDLEKTRFNEAVHLVRILMNKGFSLEESLQEAPEQFRESIRKELQED